MWIGSVGRAASGNKQSGRLGKIIFAQMSGQFECNQCPHAVTEERQGFIQKRLDGVRQISNQIIEFFDRSFIMPRASAWIMSNPYFHVAGKISGPFSEGSRTAASVREEKQAGFGVRSGARTNKPGRRIHFAAVSDFWGKPRGVKYFKYVENNSSFTG